MQTKLNGMRVAILVADDFEQVEMVEPQKALQKSGATTKIISPKSGQVTGMNHDQKAETFLVDLTLDQADPDDFDAVLLPGGALNADSLRMEPKAREFVQAVEKNNRPIAVICHASWLLVSAGLVKGHKLTSYYTIQDDIRNAGGIWVDEQMVRDHNWVSSRSPEDLIAFNQGMVSLFAEYLTHKTQTAQNVITA